MDTNILITKKDFNNKDKNKEFKYGKNLPNEENKLSSMKITDLSENSYSLLSTEELSLKKKIEKIGTPLKDWDINIYRGVLTGYNEAFIIDTEKRDELIQKDPKSEEIIKPILRGRDIKAYEAKWAGLWLISTFPVLHIDIDNYPVVRKYLEQFLPRIKQTGETFLDNNAKEQKTRKKTGNKWFEVQDQIGYYAEFEKEKIVYPCIMAKRSSFFLDTKKTYPPAPANIITGNNLKYLMGVLNSSFVYFLFRKFYMGGGIEGELKTNNLEKLSIPKITSIKQKPFINLVDKIIKAKKGGEDTKKLELEIDQMVYKLYNLTDKEIKVVENYTNNKAITKSDRNDNQKDNAILPRKNSTNPFLTEETQDFTYKRGGIDLKELQVDRTGKGIDLEFDFDTMNDTFKNGIEGFQPVIINFVPVKSIFQFLGLKEQEEDKYKVTTS